MNFVERLISFFSPDTALRREFARARLDHVSRFRTMSGRKYEGASQTSRLSLWNPADSSANTEIRASAVSLRQRARDLRRNNPFAARAVQVIATNVVGDGIRPQINHDYNNESRALKLAIEKWELWSESTACDLAGRMNFIQMQTLIMEAVAESGEVFVLRHRIGKNNDETIVPLQIQILEADFLDHNHHETLDNGAQIIQGIEFDKDGKVVAYHFFKNHPGESGVLNFNGRDTQRIPAEQVTHIFRSDRPHQARGVSWLANVMVRLHDLDIYQDATLQKQKIAACFAGYIVDPNGQMKDEDDETIELLERMDSGTLTTLPAGTDIKFQVPPSAGDYPEFMKQELRAIATGLGLTYESITSDLSNVNFSSGRMGFIEMSRNIRRWQSEIMVSQFNTPVFCWFIEALDLVTPGNMDMSKIWVSWTKPSREMIDPVKEVGAAAQAIETMQTTVSEVLRSRGLDPETIFQERSRELSRMKELGILPAAKSPEKKPTKNPTQDNEGEVEDADEENKNPET